MKCFGKWGIALKLTHTVIITLNNFYQEHKNRQNATAIANKADPKTSKTVKDPLEGPLTDTESLTKKFSDSGSVSIDSTESLDLDKDQTLLVPK